MIKKSLALILGFSLLLSSCVSGRSSQPKKLKILTFVDSICSENAYLKKKYILLPSNKDTDTEDVQYKEYATYVNKALQSRDYEQVNNPEEAEIAIFLAYGVGEPKEHQYTYNVPTWGMTGLIPRTTYGTIHHYGAYSTYSGTTSYRPQIGITGSRQVTKHYTAYPRYMVLAAYDFEIFRKNKESIQVWRTTTMSPGKSGDLQWVFPYLVAVSESWIGWNTGDKIRILIEEDDERVRRIKYGK